MRCAEFDRKSVRVMARVSSVRIVICVGKEDVHCRDKNFSLFEIVETGPEVHRAHCAKCANCEDAGA
jgi:hypothetical protein